MEVVKGKRGQSASSLIAVNPAAETSPLCRMENVPFSAPEQGASPLIRFANFRGFPFLRFRRHGPGTVEDLVDT